MKNIIKNNKGYMLVEIIIASVIALVMAYFLIDVTVKLVNKNTDYYIDSVLLTDKNIITKEIMDDINSKKLVAVEVNEDGTKAILTYDVGDPKDLVISKEPNKTTISYGDYKKEFSDKLKIEKIVLEITNNNVLSITIPAYTNYSKKDYGITVSVPYNKDIEITYPDLPDLLILGGDKLNEFSNGSYTVDMNCSESADATYDYLTKKIIVSNINVEQKAICSPQLTLTPTIPTRITLVNKIISLVGEDDNPDGSTLEKITENEEIDYRYRGIDPNNYIWFNDELWRIIGVFDENSHGIDNTYLVKIIRNDSIGSYVWDRDRDGDVSSNNYPSSDIFQLLNTAYYNSVNGTGKEYCSSNEGRYVLGGKCNFTGRGIREKYRKMVESNAKWFLGGVSDVEYTNSIMYNSERGTMVYGENDDSIIAPIGLMYASDYGYAAPSDCSSKIYDFHNLLECTSKDWLKSNYFEWTITHGLSDENNVFYYYNDSLEFYRNRFFTDATGSYSVRPVLYLKSNVYYLSGEGTQTNPYIISIDI